MWILTDKAKEDFNLNCKVGKSYVSPNSGKVSRNLINSISGGLLSCVALDSYIGSTILKEYKDNAWLYRVNRMSRNKYRRLYPGER